MPTSTIDLTTYEGRRNNWARKLVSGDFIPYLGGGLRAAISLGSEFTVPRCCCLGVAQEIILTIAPKVLVRGDRESYAAIDNPGDFTSGYLTRAAALWYGIGTLDDPITRPEVAIDEEFIEAIDAFNRNLPEGAPTASIHTINGGPASATFAADFAVDDQIGLATLNDASVPWELIAGLISRERIIDARTGQVVYS